MAETTHIAWADATWSPWRGCTKVSAGCLNCYAEVLSRRNPAVLGEWGPDGRRVVNRDWRKPLAWDRAAEKAEVRRRVFPSLCDWLEWRDDIVSFTLDFLDLIANTPHLDWLLLTKRPENLMPVLQHAMHKDRPAGRLAADWYDGAPPPNLWFGVSCEDQANANKRLPVAAMVPAAVRWVSYEPALGAIDFRRIRPPFAVYTEDNAWDSLVDVPFGYGGLDWIVVGGESKQGGREARPFRLDWARETVRQGREAGVPVFVKQLGSNPVDRGAAGDVCLGFISRAGTDMEEWPADLRVREFPKAATTAA